MLVVLDICFESRDGGMNICIPQTRPLSMSVKLFNKELANNLSIALLSSHSKVMNVDKEKQQFSKVECFRVPGCNQRVRNQLKVLKRILHTST
jgi:flagellar motor switch protein FliM